MARLTRDEFNEKYAERIIDNDDLLIEIMEDFSDSINDEEELNHLREEIRNREIAYKELKEKYKNRFLNKTLDDEDNKNDIIVEKEIIDVKEI